MFVKIYLQTIQRLISFAIIPFFHKLLGDKLQFCAEILLQQQFFTTMKMQRKYLYFNIHLMCNHEASIQPLFGSDASAMYITWQESNTERRIELDILFTSSEYFSYPMFADC